MAIFVTLTDGDKGGTTSFSGTANHWGASSDATLAANSAPNSSYAYVVAGTTGTKSLLRTATSGSATFGGQSLQLDDGADLLVKTTGTTTVNGLIMNGGVVELDGTGNARSYAAIWPFGGEHWPNVAFATARQPAFVSRDR